MSFLFRRKKNNIATQKFQEFKDTFKDVQSPPNNVNKHRMELRVFNDCDDIHRECMDQWHHGSSVRRATKSGYEPGDSWTIISIKTCAKYLKLVKAWLKKEKKYDMVDAENIKQFIMLKRYLPKKLEL